MDNITQWPWNIEEEVEWKAELQKDHEVVEELIDSAVENNAAGAAVVNPVKREESDELEVPDRYMVTAA